MSALNLTICVVLYKAEAVFAKFHEELLDSLAMHDAWQVGYYDNSPDNALSAIVARRPHAAVSYQHDPRNLGFSYANNRLILDARHPRILLLNPDVFGLSGAFWDLVAGIDTSDCARFARLLNADGSFQDCVGRISSLGRAVAPRIDYSRITEPTRVEMGIMAFMLADAAVFARVGLLDCDYRLYAEDMDWCARAGKAGVPVIYDPRIELTHIGGASAATRWQQQASSLRKYAAEAVFVDKHYRGGRWLAMRALNLAKRLRVRLGRRGAGSS